MLPSSKKNENPSQDAAVPPDPAKLVAQQSVRAALAAGIVAVLLLCSLWTLVTIATDRIFPWFSMLQGAVIGMMVRRFGKGFDYRFPLIAACLACAGALVGNLVIALPETTEQLGASVWQVVRGLTWRSFQIFFDEVITAVDYIYAGFGAVLAAFYSRRRLTRHEVFALRTMNDRYRE